MLLELRQLSKRFDGVVALSGVSLDVRQGEVLGLIGPNGSGKTTIFDLVCRITEPDSGTIHLNGRPIDELLPSELIRLGIARVFQSPQLCSRLTILENICAGSYFRENLTFRSLFWPNERINAKEALAALKFVGLQEKAFAAISSLSFFEQRRVELARALLSKPKLLLLDEPTSGFTQGERDGLEEILRRVNEAGTTLFLIEHDLSLIRRFCSRVIALDAGRKISEGSPDFVEKDEAVREIYMGAKGAVRQEPYD